MLATTARQRATSCWYCVSAGSRPCWPLRPLRHGSLQLVVGIVCPLVLVLVGHYAHYGTAACNLLLVLCVRWLVSFSTMSKRNSPRDSNLGVWRLHDWGHIIVTLLTMQLLLGQVVWVNDEESF